MAGFTDYMQQRQQPAIGSGTTEPLDMGGAKQPRLTFAQYMEQKEGPQVSQQTIKDVTAEPVGQPETPSAQPTQPQAQPMGTPQVATEAPQQALTPETQAVDDSISQAAMMGNPYATMGAVSQQPAVRKFARTEALPAIGVMGALAVAPEIGGASLLSVLGTGVVRSIVARVAMTGAAAFVGSTTGEAVEQTLKSKGIMDASEGETLPKDGYDILKRSVTKGKSDALWNAIPEIAIAGGSQMFRRLITKGGVLAKDELGNLINPEKYKFIQVMKEHGEKQGLQAEKYVTSADVADNWLTNMAENVMANSYANKAMRGIAGEQATAMKGMVKEAQEGYTASVEEYMEDNTDRLLSDFYKPNMDNSGDFALSALVNSAFNKAQDVRKSVAKGIYKTIDTSMNATDEGMVYREMETIDDRGERYARMVPTSIQTPKYTVDTTKLKDMVMKHSEGSMTGLNGLSTEYQEALTFPDNATFEQATNKMHEWKALERGVKKGKAEDSGVRGMYLKEAIKGLDEAMDTTIQQAHAAGVVGPDGKDLMTWKRKADGIWKEQIEDFEKSAVATVMKHANAVNGAPHKIAGVIMDNALSASKYQKVRDRALGELKGEELDDMIITDEAVKGQVFRDIFTPFDIQEGKFVPPKFSTIKDKEDSIRRIFGDESTEEIKSLGKILETKQMHYAHNRLAYTQATRESGMFVQTLHDVTQGQFAKAISGVVNTGLYLTIFSNVLHNKDTLRHAVNMMDDSMPMTIRYGAFRNLLAMKVDSDKRTYESMDDDDKKRLAEKQQMANSYHSDISDINK